MSNTKQYRIHAFLRTLSPLHIASPESARLSLAEMKPVYTDSKEHPPLNRTQKLSVMEPGGGTRPVPVIPANNIMGRLRRHAARAVCDVIKAKGQRIKIGTYMGLQCGAVTGNPDGRDVTFAEYAETRANPYIGLFGGGPRMMRRYVRAFNLVPFMDTTASMFGRTMHPYMDEAIHKTPSDDRKLTQCWILNRNDDLRELVNIQQAGEVIEDFEAKLAARQSALVAASSSDNRAEGDPRLSTRSFSALEFVVPGVCFPVCFELDVTDAQLGLFLVALDQFCDKERIGGHGRNGFGAFSFSEVVVTDQSGNILGDSLFANSRLNFDHEFVTPYLQAWRDSAQSLNAEDLDRLFAPPENAPKAKKSTKSDKASATDAAATEAA